MTTADILKKVRQIEIKTKGLTNHIFGGEYHSAFKGRGMSFSEVREYAYGDDIRSIDWNVTARSNTPYVAAIPGSWLCCLGQYAVLAPGRLAWCEFFC